MSENKMKHISAKELSPRETLAMLTGGVAPRPIAFVSTISKEGVHNLAPFSFFNAFGSNPPVIAFSAARRGRDGSLKDTYNNIMETKECVVQVVTYDMREKMNTASAEWASDINEFEKAGFASVDSHIVKPKRVEESPFQMECKLLQMVPLGNKNGSGNLAICEVVLFHIAESAYKDGVIHPENLDLIARNGGSFYTRAKGDALFEMPKPTEPAYS